MRTPSPLVVVASIGLVVGACSRPNPAGQDHLDLVLADNARPAQVVSAVELGREAKGTPVALASDGAVAPLSARRRAHSHRVAPLPRRAHVPERAPMVSHDPRPAIAAAPAPRPADPASAPAQEPSAQQPAEPQPGRASGGGWPEPTDGGARFPGLPGGGVIIIRGGHSGNDPCDEHGRGGIGGGIFPGLPGLPGRIGRGRPGGIVFLRGR